MKMTAMQKAVIVKWLKKIGITGFLFFLAKGLVWIALTYWVFK